MGETTQARYEISLTVQAGSLLDLEMKLVDVVGQIHNLNFGGSPVPEIDSRLREFGVSLRAMPGCAPAGRSAKAIAADIRENLDAQLAGVRSCDLFLDKSRRLWIEAAQAGVSAEVAAILNLLRSHEGAHA